MSKDDCELFGVFRYSPDLSYDELYETEQFLSVRLQEILESGGAAHLDFWGSGDCLRLQCSFPEYDPSLLRSVCEEAAALISEGVSGRLLALDRQLMSACAFDLRPGQWRERALDLDGAERGDGGA